MDAVLASDKSITPDDVFADVRKIKRIMAEVNPNARFYSQDMLELLRKSEILLSDGSPDHTALMQACADKDSRRHILQASLSYNGGNLVNLQFRNAKGNTAVCEAVQHNSPGCLRILLDAGAVMSEEDEDRLVKHATDNGYTEVLKVLEDYTSRKPGE